MNPQLPEDDGAPQDAKPFAHVPGGFAWGWSFHVLSGPSRAHEPSSCPVDCRSLATGFAPDDILAFAA